MIYLIKIKCLGRLGRPGKPALCCAGNAAFVIDQFDGIGTRRCSNSRSGSLNFLYNPADHIRFDKWPGAIVDQDNMSCIILLSIHSCGITFSAQILQSPEHRIISLAASGDYGTHLICAGLPGNLHALLNIIICCGNDYLIHSAVLECLQRIAEQGPAANLNILLRDVCPETEAFAS